MDKIDGWMGGWVDGWMDGWISIWIQGLTAPMDLGLNDRPFVPHIKSWEPRNFAKVPDGLQA